MKLFQALLLLTATAVAQGNIHRILASNDGNECEECFALIDDARDCLRECNSESFINVNGNEDGTVLNECLDPDRKKRDANGDNVKAVDSIKELSDCCEDGLTSKWDNDCPDYFEAVEACLTSCFDTCLTEKTNEWFQCVQDETGDAKDELTGEDSCSRQSCLNGFVDEEEDDNEDLLGEGNDGATLEEELADGDLGLVDSKSGSGDIFDLENIAGIFEEITEADLEECELLDGFLTSACRVGDNCCEECNTELAESLDCLLNSIVAPFVALAANTTSLVCPVPEDCEVSSKDRKALRHRALYDETMAAMSSRGQSLTGSSGGLDMLAFFDQRRLEGTATISDDVQFCINQMNKNVLAYNMTYATNRYMECTTSAALSQLQDADEPDSAYMATGALLATIASLAVAFF